MGVKRKMVSKGEAVGGGIALLVVAAIAIVKLKKPKTPPTSPSVKITITPVSELAVTGGGGGGYTVGVAPSKISATAVVTGGLSPYSYAWDFGDGTTATGQTAVHTYTTPGTYTIKVTVTDSLGETASATASWEVVSPLQVSVGVTPTTSAQQAVGTGREVVVVID